MGRKKHFKALGPHTYLAIFIAIATAFTVFIIAYAYSRIIEHFPYGGGGYIVATHNISAQAGVIAGSALLVDYILTITVSLASCGDAIFSYPSPRLFALQDAFRRGVDYPSRFYESPWSEGIHHFSRAHIHRIYDHPYSPHRLWSGNPFG